MSKECLKMVNLKVKIYDIDVLGLLKFTSMVKLQGLLEVLLNIFHIINWESSLKEEVIYST